jgi:hypothetical protein
MSLGTDRPIDEIAGGTARSEVAPEGRKFYYGDVTLVGTTDLTLADLDRRSPAPYGLSPLWQAPYGTLRGESGRYYMPVRFNHVSMTPRLHLPVTPHGGQAVDADAAARSFYGYIQSEVIGDRWLLNSRGKPGRGFSFEVTPGEKAVWREEGIMDLEMRQVGPAMQMYHPDPEMDWYYLALVTEITGTILDDPVVGVGGWELAWSNAGALDWRELAVPRRCEDMWMIYVNHYDDGAVEGAALYANARGSGVGMLVENGAGRGLRNIRSDVFVDSSGSPSRLQWSAEGRTWEWTADNPSSLTSPRNPSYLWYMGQVRELGNDRSIVSSYAYAEVLPRTIGLAEHHPG